TTVRELKEKLAAMGIMEANKQRLIIKGKLMKDDFKISEYDIKEGSIVNLVAIANRAGADQSSSTSSGSASAATQSSSNPSGPPQPQQPQAPTLNFPTSGANSFSQIPPRPQGPNQQHQQTIMGPIRLQSPAQLTNLVSSIGQLIQNGAQPQPQQQQQQQQQRVAPQLDQQRLQALTASLTNNTPLTSDDRQSLLQLLQSHTQPNHQQQQQPQRSTVNGINIHVHATPSELATLPDQLARLQSQINMQSSHTRHRTHSTGPQPQGGTLTIVSEQQVQVPHSVVQNIRSRQQQGAPQQQQQQQPTSTSPFTQPSPSQQQPTQSNTNNQPPVNPFANLLGSLGSVGSGAGIDLNGLIQQAMPMVQGFINGQQSSTLPSQSSQSNPFSFMMGNNGNASILNPQSQPQQNVSDWLTQAATALNVDVNSDNPFDAFVQVAISNLRMSGITSLASGDWSVLESTRQPIRDHLLERYLVDGTTRSQLVERALTFIEQECRRDAEIMNALNEGTNQVDSLISDSIKILRTYLSCVIDLIMDDSTSESIASNYSHILRSDRDSTFSSCIKQVVYMCTGELVDLMTVRFVNNPIYSNTMVNLLVKKLMSGLPSNLSALSGFVVNACTDFINRNYLIYKNLHPQREFSFTEAPSSSSSVATTTTTTTSASPSSPVEQQQQQQRAIVQQQQQSVQRPQQLVRQQQQWGQDLDEETIERITNTLQQDRLVMNNNTGVNTQQSEAYSGRKSNKRKRNQDTPKSPKKKNKTSIDDE
ncbi:large proline-rich protein, partial [Acrasis kona]